MYGNSKVYGNALVGGNAEVFGNAEVYCNALVGGNAEVFGNALVGGNAEVLGNALVGDSSLMFGSVKTPQLAKNEESCSLKRLSEKLENGLDNFASNEPPYSLKQLHNLSLKLRSLVGGQ